METDKLDSLENRLYQLIINRLDGYRIHDQAYQEYIYTLVRKGIGGFIIFGGERDDIRAFIDKLQSMAEIPLFIASDIERGVGQQIERCTDFPPQMAVRAAVNRDNPDDVAILRDVVRAVSLEAIDAGINMPLIPVLDVNRNPDNPIICTRAFSDNPEDVSFFGAEYIKALEGLGLISCAKHFPGHGDTSIDSHISLPVITKSYGELMDMDIKPFIEAVKTGVSSIMAGHLYVPAIDDSVPASLSKRVITDLLRKELGFDGLVMTDALNMSALAGIDNVVARSINAGVDILLHPADTDLTVKELGSAVRSKLIDEGCIDTAVERALEAKSGLQNIKRVGVDYNAHKTLSEHIADMSITLVKQKPRILPITDDNNTHVVIAGEERLCEPSLWMAQFRNVTRHTNEDKNPTPLNPLPQGEGRYNGAPIIPPLLMGGGEGEGDRRVFSDETAIFALFSEVAAWRGSSGIGDKEMEQLIELVRKAKVSIVISFGSPYILSHFKEVDMLIAAYDASRRAQKAVIRCLKGDAGFRGRLPVRL